MKAYRKLCLAALLAAMLALLCGCSAADFALPAQVDMQPGESVALASLVRYQGEDTDSISSAQAAALLADAGELAANVDNIHFDFASTVPGVVAVDDNGVMTAGLTGEATVVVSCPTLDYYAEVQVCVRTMPQSITTDTSAALNPGDTYALTTTVSPGGKCAEVIYTSSNSAVAAVDENGVITAAAPGEAVITAQVAGSSLAAQCHVSVMGVDTVQSITLTRASAQLAPGQLILLGAQAAGGSETIAWASSDEAVATVDASGLVQAVAEGSAVITASVCGKAAACALTVAAPATPETAQPGSTDGEYVTEEIALDVYWAATAETAEATATPEAAAAADKSDEAEKAATPESAAASPADATGADAADKAPATPESAASTPETSAATESATPETATPETATPETATPETAGQAMTGEDIIEAISGWINSFFGGS